MDKLMSPLLGALTLNVAYLAFRWFSALFHWLEPGDFLWKMPVFPVLIALPIFQFFAVSHHVQRIKRGEIPQGSIFSGYKEAAKLGLLTAVFLSASLWLYYRFIDTAYLQLAIQHAIAEAALGGLPADQLRSYGQTISTFNQPNLRAVFTLSGLTVFGMLSAWPATLLSIRLLR